MAVEAMRVLFPAFLDLRDRPVLLVGGGTVAAQKLKPLLEARARVTVVAPDLVPAIIDAGVTVYRRPFAPHDLDGCWYAVAAAPPAVNAEVQREGEARRVFVNAVDDPAHATAFAGSCIRRGPVTVAISTGGQAPALARLLREALERLLPESLTEWTAVADTLRTAWRREGVPMQERTGDLLRALVEMRTESMPAPAGPSALARASSGSSTLSADAQVLPASGMTYPSASAPSAPSAAVRSLSVSSAPSAAVRSSSAPSPARARSVAIVGAGPGDAALLTRRGAECLAQADLVLYDSLVSADVLALATRARLVHVGRRMGRATTTQEQVHDILASAARRGQFAVRLKGGDPFVFGRGGEDVLALAQRGVACEIVPGVSSALAAPSLAGIPVTHRGVSSGMLVVTGHDIDRFCTLVRELPSGDLTLIVLMAMHHRRAIAEYLLAIGWRPSTPAAIVRGASWREQTVQTTTLVDLGENSEPESDVPGLLVIGDVVGIRSEVAAALAWSTAVEEMEAEVCHG